MMKLSASVASVAALGASLLLALPCAARADYPDKPITMIVPWAAGGSTDQTARVLAKAAEQYLGQPIIIENKPGASTTLGMADLARSKPDGYTIGTLSSTAYLIPLQGRNVPYDPIKSFSFVSYYGDNLIGVAVLKDKPWQTLKDLIADGKENPRKIKYGTAGIGTTQHLTTESLQFQSGAKFVHIPQKGSAGSIPALLGGHVDFITETSVWAPFVESGQVRLLAVNTPKRAGAYPNVPTLHELGYQSLRSVQAIIAPAGVPEKVRAKLEAAFRKALSDAKFQQTMQRLHMEVVDLPGAEVKKLVESEVNRAKQLITKIDKK
ncbi:MAG TPA: tripartite tricarboxylate transporter substrate binding protein [Sphingomicrobium sp.]|nr:tripartite tricarboxylate transporter substrate binding protein [Sphingomicrobium sp.]